jgi:hypothetical protein
MFSSGSKFASMYPMQAAPFLKYTMTPILRGKLMGTSADLASKMTFDKRLANAGNALCKNGRATTQG